MRAHARDWAVAVLVCAVGIAGLAHDAWQRRIVMPKRGGLFQRFPTTNTTNESAIGAGRGRGCAAVAAGAGPKSAVTR